MTKKLALICHALCMELRPSKTDVGDLVPDIIAPRLRGALNLGNGMTANGSMFVHAGVYEQVACVRYSLRAA